MSMSNTTMATRRLGRSDLQVSALGMGCWAIGGAMASGDQPLGYSGVDDDEARLALERAVERGVTLFDTADAYGAGHSERLLAPVLAHHPEVLVATKFGNTIDEDRRQLTGRDTTPDYMRKALEGSLRRLSRDQIELYQLHVSDVDDSQALDLVAALEEVVAEGLVRWYGISTDDPTRVDLFATGPHCTAVQLQLNVFDDNPAALAACDRHDLAALCRSPLAMGLLGGRYNADTALPPDDIRGLAPDWLRWFTDGRPNADFLAQIDVVRDILTGDGRTLAQGALGWIWARHPRAIPLPGFRNVAQVEENASALERGPLSERNYLEVQRALGRSADCVRSSDESRATTRFVDPVI
jgi:aryl-alcohol dehydrogenase-like predicted oxidoreductase